MKLNQFWAIGFLAVTFSAFHAAAATFAVSGMRCEYLENPQGLDIRKPRLSWIIDSDLRNTRQGAYRILVASSARMLSEDQGDLWDSNKVASDESIHVEYGGKDLTSGEACYWKVQVWDDAGRVTPWSAAASWTMGLLTPGDWKGQWIGPVGSATTNEQVSPPAPMLRKTFALDKPVRRATAYICGLGYYELLINGAKAGDHVLDPPITEYDKRALYVTYDVTSQLVRGKNAIGVMLGSSWYDSTVPDAWDFQKAPWRALPQMRMQLDVEFTDGSRQEIVSDESWKIATGPILFDQTRVGEVYDARLERVGWTTANFDDSNWSVASLRGGPGGKLTASNVEPIRVMATIKPVKISQPKTGIYVLDMGQNLTGWPRLTVAGPAGTSVRMRCGERLGADGTLDNRDISKHVHSPDFQCDTYVLKGAGEEIWEPRFTFHGFQYVQAEGLPAAPTTETIVAQVVHTAFDPAGSFECSNPLLNKIEHAAVWSYTSNFVGFPSDCPHREKNGWTGDAQLAVRMGLEHFHGEAVYTQWINTLEDAQRPDGKLPCIAPTSGWGYNRLDGPAWESAYLLIPWELYQQSGDRRILESHYDGFKRWVDWYTRGAKNNIVSYGLGDWAPVKTKTPTALTSTAYYYRDLLIVAEAASLLGRTDEAGHFRKLASEVRQAFNATFFDAKTGQYANGSQTALSCALYQGMVDEAARPRVVQNLVDAVQQSDGHIDTGILGAKYLLRALSDNGRADVAWRLATQRTAPSWGSWMDQGATTLWEEWNGTESRNHVMFGDISAWFIEYLAGIRMDEDSPGYKHFVIHPLLLGDLTSAKATRNCMYGMISSQWRRTGDTVVMKVIIPSNTTASVFVPAASIDVVSESGKRIIDSGGFGARMADNNVVLSVGSGEYSFESKLK